MFTAIDISKDYSKERYYFISLVNTVSNNIIAEEAITNEAAPVISSLGSFSSKSAYAFYSFYNAF